MARTSRTVLTQTDPESFNTTLQSYPVILPFPGPYAKVGVIYDMDRAMSLAKDADILFADLKDQSDDLKEEALELQRKFESEWSESIELVKAAAEKDELIEEDISEPLIQAEKEVMELMKAITSKEEALSELLIRKTANHLVIRLDPWPYKEEPDLNKFSQIVLNWIISEGIKVAAKTLKTRSLGNSSTIFTHRPRGQK